MLYDTNILSYCLSIRTWYVEYVYGDKTKRPCIATHKPPICTTAYVQDIKRGNVRHWTNNKQKNICLGQVGI